MFIIYLGKKLKLGPDFALYQIPEIDIKYKTIEKWENIQENICITWEKRKAYINKTQKSKNSEGKVLHFSFKFKTSVYQFSSVQSLSHAK